MKVIRYKGSDHYALTREEMALFLSSAGMSATESAEVFNAILNTADKNVYGMYNTKKRLVIEVEE